MARDGAVVQDRTGVAKPRGRARQSGKTGGEERAAENAKTEDDHVDIKDEVETRRRFRTPGFQRMRLDWRGDDRVVLDRVRDSVERRVIEEFQDAYAVMFDIYNTVREPLLDDDNEPEYDQYGLPRWERGDSGRYIEDFTRLTMKERERFLFEITTNLFDWEQRQQNAWAESMFAKAIYEENYSHEHEGRDGGTIEDREAHGKINAAEDRYYAIMVTWYSKRVDALVRSLERLSLRLRDALVAG